VGWPAHRSGGRPRLGRCACRPAAEEPAAAARKVVEEEEEEEEKEEKEMKVVEV
jgi:hypothetical protein